jgi:hypothetical protein
MYQILMGSLGLVGLAAHCALMLLYSLREELVHTRTGSIDTGTRFLYHRLCGNRQSD